MRFVVRRPSPPLAPFVEALWWFAGELPHARERIMPSGAMALHVNLDEDELRVYRGEGYRAVDRIGGAGVDGPASRHVAIDTREQRRICGVAFRPGGAYPFFRPGADALVDQQVELADLWGRDGAVLRERLLEQRTPEATLAVLDAALRACAARPLDPEPLVAGAVAALERGDAVADVCDRAGMTPKRFVRHFRARVGLTPKRFARIRRFRQLIASIDAGRRVDWARVAVDAGYYDQAHLIHDFRELAGVTPTEYRPRRPGEPGHVILE